MVTITNNTGSSTWNAEYNTGTWNSTLLTLFSHLVGFHKTYRYVTLWNVIGMFFGFTRCKQHCMKLYLCTWCNNSTAKIIKPRVLSISTQGNTGTWEFRFLPNLLSLLHLITHTENSEHWLHLTKTNMYFIYKAILQDEAENTNRNLGPYTFFKRTC
jgi:hypothetical protein